MGIPQKNEGDTIRHGFPPDTLRTGERPGSFAVRAQPNLLNAIRLMLSVQSGLKKYFHFLPTQITHISASSCPLMRGVGHRHERWDGMRWTRQRRARKLVAGRFSES
jgi:hypothetical protein